MQNYMKTIISAIKLWVTEKFQDSVSDWNQNDESALGYIKNRPFYGDVTKNYIIERRTVNIDEEYGYQSLGYITKLEVGKTYYVTLNDVEYECVARFWSDESVLIGNGTIYGDDDVSNGEPFSCDSYEDGEIYLNVKDPGEYTVSIAIIHNNIKKIDKKYLPDGIGGGADWNQNDPNGDGYVENRTHWVEKEFKQTTFVDNMSVEFSSDGEPTLNPFEIEIINGETYTVTWDGDVYECVAYVAEAPGTPSIGNGPLGEADNRHNDEPFFITVYEGVVMVFSSNAGTHTITIAGNAEKEVIHHLDSKYIKDMYYEEVVDSVTTTVVEEQTVSGFFHKQNGIYECQNPFEFMPIIGDTYMISWDGVEYELECLGFNANVSWPYIGNENYVALQSGGDIPFAILFIDGNLWVATESTNESHSIGIQTSGGSETIIHKIDPKYLPDNIGRSISDVVVLKDAVTDYDYVCEIRNGNFVTYCKCDYIQITKMPIQTKCTIGGFINTDGMEVVAVAQNGTTRGVENYTVSATGNDGVVTVYYEEVGSVYETSFVVSIISDEEALIDFDYIANDDGTYTIIDWYGTYNGEPSSKVVIPDSALYSVELEAW